jgi:hypothetical protein
LLEEDEEEEEVECEAFCSGLGGWGFSEGGFESFNGGCDE